MRFIPVLLVAFACTVAPSCGSSGSSNPLPPGTMLDQFTLNVGGSSLVDLGEYGIGGQTVQLAQTFTVGKAGMLVAIDIIAGGAESDLTVRIMPAPAGVIDENNANALATITIREDDVAPPGFLTFLRLPGSGIPVAVGDQLAITLDHPDGSGKCLESSSAYDRGHSFERDNRMIPTWSERTGRGDLFFGTYVAP